jgi:hypothetical protein
MQCPEHHCANDEAHHAWRTNAEATGKYQRTGSRTVRKKLRLLAGGLDKIHEQKRNTKMFSIYPGQRHLPFAKKSAEDALFTWIVSDLD